VPFNFLFLAVVFHDNYGDQQVLDSVSGFIGAEDLITRLINVLDIKGHILDKAKEEQLTREYDRKIQEEQDRQFAEALALDSEKQQQEAEENRKRREEEIFQQLDTTLQELNKEQSIQQKKRKAEQLIPEPVIESNSTRIAVRLTDGTKIERRFPVSATIQDILDFVDTRTEERIDGFELITNFPSRTFTNPMESLEEAKLVPQAILFLRQKEQ